MRYAIVESGGKQYRAVEGSTIEVDRLPVTAGASFDDLRVLLITDGDEVMVGTPTIPGVLVKTTVLDHIKGPKVVRFKYRPKKRIRVRGGHRQQYTRLVVDFIGRPGEERKVEKAEKPIVKKEADAEAVVETKAKAEKAPKAEKQAKALQEAGRSSVKKTPAKSVTRKTTTTKATSKKPDTKKK